MVKSKKNFGCLEFLATKILKLKLEAGANDDGLAIRAILEVYMILSG